MFSALSGLCGKPVSERDVSMNETSDNRPLSKLDLCFEMVILLIV